MSVLKRLSALWRNLVHRTRVQRDVDDELRSTLDMLVDAHVRKGMPLGEARRAAAIQLGGLTVVTERVREAKAGAGLASLAQDLRYGARALRRAPLFTLTAVLSLGVGMAGVAVVFGLADAFLLRAQPGLREPARLAEVGRVRLSGGVPTEDGGFNTFSYPN